MEVEFIEQGHIYLVDGVITPSVSDILKFLFPKKYANIPESILKAKSEFGTHIHEAIEAYEKGKEPRLTDMERVTFNQYLRLKKEYQIKPITMEEIVHYEDRFAGKLDMTAYVLDEESLIDAKTTAKLDKEMVEWQLGFYQFGKGKIFKRHYCLWLPKKELGRLAEIDAKTQYDILEVLDRYEKQKGKIVCYF